MLVNRSLSLFSTLLVILILLLVYQYGQPLWFGEEQWAIHPLNQHNMKSIWLGAFVHGSWDHLTGNVFALFIFSLLFMIQFPKQWFKFWLLQHLVASFILWLIGNWGISHSLGAVAHIGASIWVYSFGGFLITTAIVQRTKQSFAIFFLVLLFYGGFFWGILPIDPKVSWQGHLSGLLTGVIIALTWGLKWLPRPLKMGLDQDDPYENF